MAKRLGIVVSSNKHLDKIKKLCQAAQKKDVEVTVFFTHLGTLVTQDPAFIELEGLAHLSLCNVGFESHGLKRPVPGVSDKDYATQARHGEMLEDCERCVYF